ncbi:MAG: mechanosensitive ion channel domain-containing protein [Verrucomicrobiota bacterium]
MSFSLLVVPIGGFSQESNDGLSSGTDTLSISGLEREISAIESDGGLDELTRGILLERYREALEFVTQQAAFRIREEEFRDSLQKGPEQREKIQSEIEAFATGESSAPIVSLDSETSEAEIETALSRLQGSLSQWQEEERSLESELAVVLERPASMRERLFSAQGELKTAQSAVESAQESLGQTPSPSERAEAIRLDALTQKLASEVAMLEQESESQDIRVLLLEAHRDLLEAKITDAESRITAFRDLASQRLGDQVRMAVEAVEEVRKEITDPSPVLQSLEDELKQLSKEVERSNEGINEAEESLRIRETERQRILDAFSLMKRELSAGGNEGSMGQLLVERLRTLPSKQEGRKEIERIRKLITEVQGKAYEVERRIIEAEAGAVPLPEKLEDFEEEVEKIRTTREVLRSDLQKNYRQWIRELSALELIERQLVREVGEYREFAVEKLFWVRDSRIDGSFLLRDLRIGLHYCVGWYRWKEVGSRLADISIFRYLILFSLIAVLLRFRPKIDERLQDRGQKIRHISTNRFSYTVEAFILTLVWVLPGPLLTAAIGWEFVRQEDASEWSHGFGGALLQAGWYTLQIGLLIGLCRKGGLGEVHFQWDPEILRQLGRRSVWLIPAFLPTLFLLNLILSDPTLSYLNSLGRFAGIFGSLAVGIVVAGLMHPRKGLAAQVHESNPSSVFGKWRFFWFYLVVAVAVVQVGLLLSGFVFTGILLLRQAEVSATAILVAIIIFGFLTRWFLIRERRLTLEEALEKRAARLEAAREDEDQTAESGQDQADDSRIPEVEEEEILDLDTVSEQTRKLISFFIGIGLFAALWVIWTEFAPVLSEVNQWKGIGGFTLGDLALTVVVFVVVFQTLQNLPGLLEIAILRRLDIDPGTRTAITTLAKYAIVAIGAVILFNEIGIDWSKFGWIAAALGVGIGFGLQEVVANFICGIILLFERPIRVGDVVTVDGIDGVVSKIQIRATTITNWDRKEFIVPNKNFITGTVLNWTLSNQLTRLVIPVGVAYGTDTKEAREILLSVAEDHERILDDPAPLTTFEAFDDSSLRLLLRCFLPDMENRLVVVSELHDEIAERFKEAEIEIAFPQQDLHIRTLGSQIGLERDKGS